MQIKGNNNYVQLFFLGNCNTITIKIKKGMKDPSNSSMLSETVLKSNQTLDSDISNYSW